MRNRRPSDRPARAWAYLLLLIPFVALLWVPFYASASPAVAGIPLFYWYQFVWILISAVLTAVVYLVTGGTRPRTGDEPADGAGRVSRG